MSKEITMNGLSSFIASYPTRDEPSYQDEMGVKREFRELLFSENEDVSEEIDENDPFFYNYQMLVGRWWAPWTNNRIGLIRWDPGTGKTRASLIFALMWMRYSNHKKVLFVSDQEVVLRAITAEVISYYGYNVELERTSFTYGSKGHGKAIKKTRYINSKGFEKHTIRSLLGLLEKAAGTAGIPLRDYIRDTYKDYVIIVDEVHTLRDTDGKVSYNALITLLDSVRDICPILLMTATPITDTWRDAISILGMLWDPETREDIISEADSIDEQSENASRQISDLVKKYSGGLVSDRTSTGVIPDKIPLPCPLNTKPDGSPIQFSIVEEDESGETRMNIDEDIYPVFLSSFQTEEASKVSREQSSFYEKPRHAYDFVTPDGFDINAIVDSRPGQGDLPIVGAEDIFRIVWREATDDEISSWNTILTGFAQRRGEQPTLFSNNEGERRPRYQYVRFPSTDEGLGKYSAKYSSLVWMLEYHPLLRDIPGYVHTLWKLTGTRLMAAVLNANGWQQYTGNIPIDSQVNRTQYKGRFAIIDGEMKPNAIDNIITAFNSRNNRSGQILRVIIGSRISGKSISLSNGRFFLEMSSDFNRTMRIQSEGRVFRADSLLWRRELGLSREVFVADIIGLPYLDPENEEEEKAIQEYIGDLKAGEIRNKDYISGENEESLVNPFTIEIGLFKTSKSKYMMTEVVLAALKESSIETMIEKRLDRPEDNSTHALIYGLSVQKDIERRISKTWEYGLDPNNMYMMRTAANTVSNHTMYQTRYGMMCPLQSFGRSLIATRDPQLQEGSLSSYGSFSLAYEKYFFLPEEQNSYPPDTLTTLLEFLRHSPSDPYEFMLHISSHQNSGLKAAALETAISFPYSVFTEEEKRIFESRRKLILDLYADFWDSYMGGRIIHILWYAVKHNSQLSKARLSDSLELKTRVLFYNEYRRDTEYEWKYIDNLEREKIYHSLLSQKVNEKQNRVIENAGKYGYFVHFSLFDGRIILREIPPVSSNMKIDWRQSNYYDISTTSNIVLPILARIMDIDIPTIMSRYENKDELFQKDFFFKAREKGILIIR